MPTVQLSPRSDHMKKHTAHKTGKDLLKISSSNLIGCRQKHHKIVFKVVKKNKTKQTPHGADIIVLFESCMKTRHPYAKVHITLFVFPGCTTVQKFGVN